MQDLARCKRSTHKHTKTQIDSHRCMDTHRHIDTHARTHVRKCDINEHGEEFIRPGLVRVALQDAVDDLAAVQHAHHLVARCLVRVHLAQLLHRHPHGRVRAQLRGNVKMLRAHERHDSQAVRQRLWCQSGVFVTHHDAYTYRNDTPNVRLRGMREYQTTSHL